MCFTYSHWFCQCRDDLLQTDVGLTTQDFAADLIGNASANATLHLYFGVVLIQANVSYELPLSDDYAELQQQLRSESSFTFPATGPRRTAAALQTCGDVILTRGHEPIGNTVLMVLTAGVSEDVIVVIIILTSCCLICIAVGVAFFVWHSLRKSAPVMPDIEPVSVVPPMPSAAPPRPPPQPKDETQKALREAIDMHDITRLRTLLSDIFLKGWPEKKYSDPRPSTKTSRDHKIDGR
eukprot:Skav218991  [mRNA]  locus=scaffold169:179428:183647:+ [translate_table: standard]